MKRERREGEEEEGEIGEKWGVEKNGRRLEEDGVYE